MDAKPLDLINSLPPLVAILVWDVYTRGIVDISTIDLAQSASEDEYRAYDLVRCLAAGNPEYITAEDAIWLVRAMLEEVPCGAPA